MYRFWGGGGGGTSASLHPHRTSKAPMKVCRRCAGAISGSDGIPSSIIQPRGIQPIMIVENNPCRHIIVVDPSSTNVNNNMHPPRQYELLRSQTMILLLLGSISALCLILFLFYAITDLTALMSLILMVSLMGALQYLLPMAISFVRAL